MICRKLGVFHPQTPEDIFAKMKSKSSGLQ